MYIYIYKYIMYTPECTLVTVTETGSIQKEQTTRLSSLITFDYGQVEFEESLLIHQMVFNIK